MGASVAGVELSADALQQVFAHAACARLATHRAGGAPGLVPLVFAEVDGVFWSPIDGKPKARAALARLRDIAAQPRASLLFDGFYEDWRLLWWVRVEVDGEVVRAEAASGTAPDGLVAAAAALRRKYPQYRETALFSGRPTALRMIPQRVTSWAASPAAERRIREQAHG